MRIFVGGRLFYGVIDNVISWADMIEFSEFLKLNQFPMPLLSAVMSVYAQLLCSVLLMIGYKLRWAAIILLINFGVAIIFVHLIGGDSVEGTTPALAMFFGCLTLLFTGAGKLSFDDKTDP